MKPLLSVIVPVYNVEKYLKRCLESILVQSWNDYEIILVDDGSTDSSAQICDLYAEKYEMIRVIHKENKGLSDTRNRGIEEASGEYVYFPDSDDWLEPNTFSELSDVIEELKAADAAGMMTCQMVRDSKQRTGEFRKISSFDELLIE